MNGNTISKKLKIGIVASLIVLTLLIVAVIVFTALSKVQEVEIDGDKYTIKEEKYCYRIFNSDNNELEKTPDGYYLLTSGNLLEFDVETGEYSIYAYIDKEGTEQLYTSGRVLIFPYQNRDSIKKISIKNSNGEWAIEYNGTSFVIVDKTATILRSEYLSQLLTVAGYSLGLKLDKTESLDKFGYEEYGLDNPQAEYTVETVNGDKYAVQIGDITPDGYGYYARYALDDREAVYILTATDYIEESLLSGVESLVAPILAPNLGYNMYLNVQNCTLNKHTYDAEGKKTTKNILRFSYLSKINGTDRLKTEYKSQPYFGLSDFAMYVPSADSINEMLYNLYSIEPLAVVQLGTDNLNKFGLDKPSTTLYYENSFSVSGIATYNKIYIYFSEKTASGLVYAYSEVFSSLTGEGGSYSKDPTYNQVVVLDANTVDFLNFTKANFVNSNYFSLFFDYLSSISFKYQDKEYKIEVSHTDDDYEIVATDSAGKSYVLTSDEVQYENKYKKVVTAKSTDALFSNLYQMLLTSSIIGEHNLDSSEVESLTNDGNKLLEMTVTTTSGRVMSYKYYALSEVRSIITMGVEKTPGSKNYVESNDFFCYSSRIEKMISDFENFFLALSYYEKGNYGAFDAIEISSR